jgi:signal transduction histidine kinase
LILFLSFPLFSKDLPQVKAGVLDLKDWNYYEDGPINLDGEWEFYWNTLLVENPSNPEAEIQIGCEILSQNTECQGYQLRSDWKDFSKKPDALITTPSSWTNPNFTQGNMFPPEGSAVYHLKFSKPIPRGFSYQRMKYMTTSHRTWGRTIRGSLVLLSYAGKPSLDPKYLRESQIPEEKVLWEDITDLYVEISNENSSRPGLYGRIKIGRESDFEDTINKERMDLISSGILLMAGIFNFMVFWIRRSSIPSLFLSITCFMAFTRVMVLNALHQESFLNFRIINQIEYATIPILWFGFYYYTRHFLKDLKTFHPYLPINLLFLSNMIFVLIGGRFMSQYLIVLQISILVSSVFTFARIFKSLRNPQSNEESYNAKFIILFFLILVIVAISDILSSRGIVPFPQFLGYAIVMFLLGQTYLVARSNNRAWNESDRLYHKLEDEVQEKSLLQKSVEDLETQKNLATSQLIQAEKLSSLGAMVAGIAHEINNPVNFIEMARFDSREKLESLKEYLFQLIPDSDESKVFREQLSSKFQELLELNSDVQKGVKRVVEINQSMRNASRSDQVATSNVDLADVMKESLVILGSKTKLFAVEQIFPDTPVTITCKRSQIGQVVMNLVSNAADALNEKRDKEGTSFQGKIRVSLIDGEKSVEIRVEDNGYGIPEDKLSLVRNAFYTTKPVGVGTGLGLAICGTIIDSHKGSLLISRSKEMGGAEFQITLPKGV